MWRFDLAINDKNIQFVSKLYRHAKNVLKRTNQFADVPYFLQVFYAQNGIKAKPEM